MSRSEFESILEGLMTRSSGLLKHVYCNLLNNLRSNTHKKITTLNDLRCINGFSKPILEDIEQEQMKRGRAENRGNDTSRNQVPDIPQSPDPNLQNLPATPEKPQSPGVRITPPPASPPPSMQTIPAPFRKSSKKVKRSIQRKKGRTRYTRGFISESSESNDATLSSQSSDGNRMTGNVCIFLFIVLIFCLGFLF